MVGFLVGRLVWSLVGKHEVVALGDDWFAGAADLGGRLGIEGVHVAHAASHEHENNPLGLGFEMRPPGRDGIFPGRHQVRDQAGQDQASPGQRLDGLSPI